MTINRSDDLRVVCTMKHLVLMQINCGLVDNANGSN